MPILNYTTQINAGKSAAEVQDILAKGGAKSVSIDYNDRGEPDALTFTIIYLEAPIHFRLPCNVDGVYKALCGAKGVPYSKQTKEQARRVAWRIIKDWVEAQLAIVQSRQAQLTEVFLPYVVAENGQTMFQAFTESKQKQLTAGSGGN
jgi:hypothetical protein